MNLYAYRLDTSGIIKRFAEDPDNIYSYQAYYWLKKLASTEADVLKPQKAPQPVMPQNAKALYDRLMSMTQIKTVDKK